MDTVILGSGHVAAVLGKRLAGAGHRVRQVWSRNLSHAGRLAVELQASATSDLSMLFPADLFLVSVKDDAYAELAAQLPQTTALILHTGGAVPGAVFKKNSPRYGVLYPLQSIRRETAHLPEIPLLIDATPEAAYSSVQQLALSISPLVQRASDRQRLEYHLAAVFTANFANHLFALAEGYCLDQGLDFSLLRPLLEETVLRMRHGSPADLQTGPALRGDQGTLDRHRGLLQAYPSMAGIYDLLTQSITDFYR